MKYGFIRLCAASPKVTVADCSANALSIIKCVHKASAENAKLIVFPELCITGYTCGDLFLQKTLQESAIKALLYIAEKTAKDDCIFTVGLPIAVNNTLFNCAAVLCRGKICGIIPKTFIPNYSEFYEKRYFSQAPEGLSTEIALGGKNSKGNDERKIPFGTNILFTLKDFSEFVLGVELCEDVWAPLPPSISHALNGATIIANLSASNEVIGKASYRRNLISMQSAKIIAGYVYADAGHGESTQDLVFASHNLIAENGSILAESDLFEENDENGTLIFADSDLEKICQERKRTTTFYQAFERQKIKQIKAERNLTQSEYTIVELELKNTDFSAKESELKRFVDPNPFVPSEKNERSQRCMEVITLQAEGLAKRLRHINAKSAVIGLSGGLDSTLALLVTCRAFDLCNIDRKGILAVTMPCFGTTDRTYTNACTLAKKTGCTLKEVKISDSVLQHFKDIGHDKNVHDVTYENSQARERTQVLMDLANQSGGIVIGTGDLSELALGWATYNGDHMSMYGVNSSIPKTLVRYLVEWFSEKEAGKGNKELSEVLKDILTTPVSPELLPPEDGKISQKTEELVGPYELHDFFLYFMLRFGFTPEKIFFLAKTAFRKKYTDEIILKWLKTFYRRFFSQQFKRSCMPDGAKVGTVSLSPRGDWRMPSDASSKLWLDSLENISASASGTEK